MDVCDTGAASGRVSHNLAACRGPERNQWWSPFSDASDPDYHDDECPDDYGWDAAGLATDPAAFGTYREAELIHARGDMVGNLGYLAPELLAKQTGMQIDQPIWFKAGAQSFPQGGLDYIDNSNLVHAQWSLAGVTGQLALMGAFKTYHVNGDPLREALHLRHPGEASDPLVLDDDPDTFAALTVGEIQNGRLEMLSMCRPGRLLRVPLSAGPPVSPWSLSPTCPPPSALSVARRWGRRPRTKQMPKRARCSRIRRRGPHACRWAWRTQRSPETTVWCRCPPSRAATPNTTTPDAYDTYSSKLRRDTP